MQRYSVGVKPKYIHVYLNGSISVCLRTRGGECLLYTYDMDNLDRERKQGGKRSGDLAEPCEDDEWVVTWSPFGASAHQNKPCEQCLLGKRFASTEAVRSTICHLWIKCHTQADTNLRSVCFGLFYTTNKNTHAYKSYFSILASCFDLQPAGRGDVLACDSLYVTNVTQKVVRRFVWNLACGLGSGCGPRINWLYLDCDQLLDYGCGSVYMID